MNLKFSYLYRDASNYKNFGSIVFSNSNVIPLEIIESTVRANLIDGEYFNAEEWSVSSLFFEEKGEDDHNWHEFESIVFTNENATSCPIEDFLIQIEKNK